MIKSLISSIVLAVFFISQTVSCGWAANVVLPEPGAMVNLSPVYQPVMIQGIRIHPDSPFLFDFIINAGNAPVSGGQDLSLKQESEKLIKYFLTAMTVPEKDLWVNLSPYEKNRMIEDGLGQTQMGQDMLAQDYLLKQLTASLIYPEKELGKTFWNKVYAKAQQLYGTTQIPVNTFNKVWIIADRADIFERNNTAYIVGSHLKVMLEEDYLSLQKHKTLAKPANNLASQIVREIVLPELEKEVNTGKNFALLRQMFHSMILASWYKTALKDAILTQIYGNQNKVTVGVNADDPREKEEIFQRYLQAYKKGVFNYIKQDIDQATRQPMPRKYFSGGLEMNIDHAMRVFHDQLPPGTSLATGNTFDAAVEVETVSAKAGSEGERTWQIRKEAFLRDKDLRELPSAAYQAAQNYFDAIHQASGSAWTAETVFAQRGALINALIDAGLDRTESFLKFNALILYLPVKEELMRIEKEAFLRKDWQEAVSSDEAMSAATKEGVADILKGLKGYTEQESFATSIKIERNPDGVILASIHTKQSPEREGPGIDSQLMFRKMWLQISYDIMPRLKQAFPGNEIYQRVDENQKNIIVIQIDPVPVGAPGTYDLAMRTDYKKNPQRFAVALIKESLRIDSNMAVRLLASKAMINKPGLFSGRDLVLAKEAVSHALRYPGSTVDEARLTAAQVVLSRSQSREFKDFIPLAVNNLKDMLSNPQSKTSSVQAAALVLQYPKIEGLKDLSESAQEIIRQAAGRIDTKDGLEADRGILLSKVLASEKAQAKQALDAYLNTLQDPQVLTGPDLLWVLDVLDITFLNWKQWALSAQVNQRVWFNHLLDTLLMYRDQPRKDPYLRVSAADAILTYERLVQSKDQAMTVKKELKNGVFATEQEAAAVLDILTAIKAKEQGNYTQLLEEVYEMAKRPAYYSREWNMEKLLTIPGFEHLFDTGRRDIVLSAIEGSVLQRTIGSPFKDGSLANDSRLQSIPKASFVNSRLKRALGNAQDIIQRLETHAEDYSEALQKLRTNQGNTKNIIDRLDQLDNFEQGLISAVLKTYRLNIEFNKDIVNWNLSDQAMMSDEEKYINDMSETGKELARLRENLKIIEDDLKAAPADANLLARQKRATEDIATLEERFKRLENLLNGGQAADEAMKGGIDFDRSKMQMNVSKDDQGVRMQFDPAMIKRIQQEGFDGLKFRIKSIVPVSNIPILLGLESPKEQRLASAL